jgi:hypothetical protein
MPACIIGEVSGTRDDRIRVLWLTKGLGPAGAQDLLVSLLTSLIISDSTSLPPL